MEKDTLGKIIGAVLVIVLGIATGKITHHASQVNASLEEAHAEIEKLNEASPPELAAANRILQAEVEVLGKAIETIQAELEQMRGFDQQAAQAIQSILNPQQPEGTQ